LIVEARIVSDRLISQEREIKAYRRKIKKLGEIWMKFIRIRLFNRFRIEVKISLKIRNRL
jgi:hypothetical protein